MKDSKYYKKMCLKKNNKELCNNVWISKLLISIIIVLSSLIVTNFNSDIKDLFKENVLESNISFSKLNKLYQKYIGEFIKSDSGEVLVANNDNELNNQDIKEEDGSYIIEVDKDYPINFMASGIIVYIGEKDDLGNTVIVQGNDGVDLWYSNIFVSDYSLYDYVKKGDILGSTNSEYLKLTIMKDGTKLSYDEYFK